MENQVQEVNIHSDDQENQGWSKVNQKNHWIDARRVKKLIYAMVYIRIGNILIKFLFII
jgi:hypothetical protein